MTGWGNSKTNNPGGQTTWSDALVERVRIMWEDKGMSASAIARKLGMGHSRCAIMGIINRRNMQTRVAKVRRTGVRIYPKRQPKKDAPLLPQYVEIRPALVLESGAFIDLENLAADNCHWPIGDPDAKDFHYCGHPPMKGKSYCEAHAFLSSKRGGSK